MKINLDNFKGVFFEENEENLQTLEDIVVHLRLDEENIDEKINNIFRVVHSLKGGSATFGFQKLIEISHKLETYLDMVRSSQLCLEQEGIDVMIESLDKLRDILKGYKLNQDVEAIDVQTLIERVNVLISAQHPGVNPEQQLTEELLLNPVALVKKWHVIFKPNQNIFLTGNDPIKFIQELGLLGKIVVKTNIEKLPNLIDLDAELSYFDYEVFLETDKSESEIKEVFVWIEDEALLEFKEGFQLEEEKKEPVLLSPPKQTPPKNQNKVEDAAKTSSASQMDEQASIRVNVDKIDQLLNMVGELVITQSMLGQIAKKMPANEESIQLQEGLQLLDQNIRELQESVMKVRMVPIQNVFNRVPRIIYDLSKKLGKEVDLKIYGEQTELDKTVLEKIGDPLVHLVRNALDHGMENPEERLLANKPAKGVLSLSASHQSGNILIKISDDGRGLNRDKILKKAMEKGLIAEGEDVPESKVYQLIFEPGFSTADAVSEVSGRGVGMDVVRRNIQSLGGQVKINSKAGEGSDFIIQLPLTLAILDSQLVRICGEIFIVPIVNICETLQVDEKNLKTVSGRKMLYYFREEFIPIVDLHQQLLGNQGVGEKKSWDRRMLIIVEEAHSKVGITVDELLDQQPVVIKSLEENFKKILGISGATILGDGRVALILDVPHLVHLSAQREMVSA